MTPTVANFGEISGLTNPKCWFPGRLCVRYPRRVWWCAVDCSSGWYPCQSKSGL